MSDAINSLTGANSVVDTNSLAYLGGQVAGLVVLALATDGAGDEAEMCEGGNCFIAGIPVQMAHDQMKPIQAVKIGDWVQSRNPQTGKTELKRVVRLYRHLAHQTLTVQLADAKTGQVLQTLTATPQHRFFVVGRGAVPLGQLGIGTQIITRAGPALVIASLVKHEYPQGVPVYNFEVADDHTYFVGKTNGGTWVHNICPDNLGELMSDSPLNAGQNEVNGPVVDAYVDMLNSGQEPPPIQVEEGSNVIINGHHRYVAGQIFGEAPPIEWIPQGQVPSNSVPWDQVYVDPNPPPFMP